MAFAAQEIHQFEARDKCCFCQKNTVDEFRLGKIYKLKNLAVHYFCLLFASHLQQNGSDRQGLLGFLPNDIEKELRNKASTNCSYCGKPGAASVCARKGCKMKFHFPCGIENQSFHLFHGQFESFCFAHRKRQVLRIPPKTEAVFSSICLICQGDIEPKPSLSNLLATCCKTVWFHKDCVQRLALSSGYFFKCPNCNNKDDFRNEMLQNGIYIPDQDAAWELEPNSFSELTERYNSCDAEVCVCEKGRKFSQSKGPWKIKLCHSCGSQGVHYSCGQGSFNERDEWNCNICSAVLRVVKRTSSRKISTSSNANSNSTPQTVVFPTPATRTAPKRSATKTMSDTLSTPTYNVNRGGMYQLRNISRVSLAEPKLKRTRNQTYPQLDNTWKKKKEEMREIVSKKIPKSDRIKYMIDGVRVWIPPVYIKLLKTFQIRIRA